MRNFDIFSAEKLALLVVALDQFIDTQPETHPTLHGEMQAALAQRLSDELFAEQRRRTDEQPF